jgi:hypothetical protein
MCTRSVYHLIVVTFLLILYSRLVAHCLGAGEMHCRVALLIFPDTAKA